TGSRFRSRWRPPCGRSGERGTVFLQCPSQREAINPLGGRSTPPERPPFFPSRWELTRAFASFMVRRDHGGLMFRNLLVVALGASLLARISHTHCVGSVEPWERAVFDPL